MEINRGDLSDSQKLADHIKKNLQKGYDADTLKYALLSQGYSRTAVERSIELAQKQLLDPKEDSEKNQEQSKTQFYDVDEQGYADMTSRVELEETPGFFERLKRKFFD